MPGIVRLARRFMNRRDDADNNRANQTPQAAEEQKKKDQLARNGASTIKDRVQVHQKGNSRDRP